MTTVEARPVATGLPRAEPESLGLSSERLARIGAAMRRHIDGREAPGTVTLVARHGRTVHWEAQGSMDIQGSAPLPADAIFRIASMTKPVTSVAAMILYEEGNFFLDDPISKFLPAFKSMTVSVGNPPPGVHIPAAGASTVPAMREITVRDCLTHTAGFGANGTGPRRAPTDTVADAVAKLATRPLAFQPGTNWRYGPGHDVAGVLVETISGQTLEEFFKDRIFGPLGMPDSSFYLPEEKISRFPSLYQSALLNPESGWRLREVDRPETSPKVKGPRLQFAGGGGMLTTAPDYARFAQMLLNGGELDGVRILGRKTVELMTTNHVGDFFVYVRGRGYGYGLGLGIRTDLSGFPAVGSVGTYGWGGATGTFYSADPRERLICLLFQQVNAAAGDENERTESDQAPAVARRIGQELEQLAYQSLVD